MSVGVVALVWSSTASASWTVTDLGPSNSSHSIANAVGGGQQVGDVYPSGFSGQSHASLWTGTAASWVDLNPSGADYSHAVAVSGGHQVGYVTRDGYSNHHASLWSGTAASWVDLSGEVPVGGFSSAANGIDGDQIVGSASFISGVGGGTRATLWTGFGASYVNLNPAGCLCSERRPASGLCRIRSGRSCKPLDGFG